jgi:hypothetical protein
MALRRCIDCFRWALPGKSRCPIHERVRQRDKDAKRPQRRTHQAITTNAQLVQAWVDEHGWWCPGVPRLGRAAHPATRLTAQHDQPVALGGEELAPSGVLCLPCNSADGATVRRC